VSRAAQDLIQRLAAEQTEAALADAAPIDASTVFHAQRRRTAALTSSYAAGRRVLAWAEAHGARSAPCFEELVRAMGAGHRIALLLIDCWLEFPASQRLSISNVASST